MLVATSVIEVGIDVANASVMLIEGADRYGLSQLHQLRGRIGRGEHESHCILFADPESERARARLEAIGRERDGFELAEVDLSLRGEGEVLGTRQSGLPRFRVASLPDDAAAARARPARTCSSCCARTARSNRAGARTAGRSRSRLASATSGWSRSPHEPGPVRIVAGELGGRRLRAPRSAALRPTSDRVREALFSILGDVDGLRVLDLFCGTGALGIEALSRGADRATFVDTAIEAATRNVADLERRRAKPARREPTPAGFLERDEGEYDLVFCDPPYKLARRLGPELDSPLDARLAPDARVIAETGADDPMELDAPAARRAPLRRDA